MTDKNDNHPSSDEELNKDAHSSPKDELQDLPSIGDNRDDEENDYEVIDETNEDNSESDSGKLLRPDHVVEQTDEDSIVSQEETVEESPESEEDLDMETMAATHTDEVGEEFHNDVITEEETEGVDEEDFEVESESDKVALTPLQKFAHGFSLVYEISKRVLFVLIILLILGVSFAGGAGAGFFASLVEGKEIPPFEEMKAEVSDISISSQMFYGSGEAISDLRSDLKRTPITIDAVSPHIKEALIATEDEYFYRHPGIVPKAIARAMFQEFSGAYITSGGSTLTQQLVKQQILTNEVSFERKANEILLALRLEKTMEKDEILEAYLNVSPFGRNNRGNNIAGVEEAARGVFGVSAADVTLAQAAFIAGLPQSPIAYTPYNEFGEIKDNLDAGINRQQDVLYRMFREEFITEDEYNEAKEYDITQDFIVTEKDDSLRNDQSFVYDAVEKAARDILINQLITEDEKTLDEVTADPDLYNQYYEEADSTLRYNGYKIYSTVDRDLHNSLEQVTYDNRQQLGREKTVSWYDEETEETYTRTKPVQNSSVTLDNQTGRIIAFVGGIDYKVSQVNMALDSRRQPGSVIKPLVVYGPGLDTGVITASSIAPDTDYSVPTVSNGRVTEHPITNDGPTTNEWMTVRESLSRSQNIPTVKFYDAIRKSINPIEYLRKMGWGERALSSERDTGHSVALGGLSSGPTNLELTSAFATIANNGVHVEPYLIERIEDKHGEVIYQHEHKETRVFSPETAFLLQDILRDVMTTGTARGTKEALNFNADIISKTGTTNDTIDIWYVASTPNVTVSSWIGYSNIMVRSGLDWDYGIPPARRNRMHWARMMNKINEMNPTILGKDQRFRAPSGIKTESVLVNTGMKPGTVTSPSGDTFTASGDTRSEYFNSAFLPKTTVYDFAFSATDKELSDFWGSAKSEKDEEAEEEENKKKETEDENQNEDEEEDTPSSSSDNDESSGSNSGSNSNSGNKGNSESGSNSSSSSDTSKDTSKNKDSSKGSSDSTSSSSSSG